jgi:hypothetical protein
MRIYLHEGLDLDAATRFWSGLTAIPVEQFTKPYRARPDPSIRHSKHAHGCAYVSYSCSRTLRGVMGLVEGMLSPDVVPLARLRGRDSNPQPSP